MEYRHTPVMLKEVLDFLQPRPGQNFIDCTLGGGGYTIEIAKKIIPGGKVLAIDLDEIAIENAKCKMQNAKLNNIILSHDNFKNLSKIVQNLTPALSSTRRGGKAGELFQNGRNKKIFNFNGIVFDLGLSSAQLQDRRRGFSFQLDAPLDMRFAYTRIDTNGKRIATNYDTKYIINKWKQGELERILREHGEERYARRIAGAIVKARRGASVKTTGQLVEIIKKVVPAAYKKSRKIHFATRTFQALRIATNRELDNLEEALPQAIDLLRSGGRIAVISYHSLEDRIVKQFFKRESNGCLCPPLSPVCQCHHQAKLKILTQKPIRPGEEEIKNNPRARSARMRVAEKI